MMSIDGTHLMPGPLYHNGPFVWSTTALLAGNHVVLGGRFDAEKTLAADRPVAARLDVHRADDDGAHLEAARRTCATVTTCRRCKVVWHLAAPCPPWLKEEWIEWLGADAIWELYAGTEAQVGDHHHRRRVARAPRLGRPPDLGRDEGRRRRRRRLPPGEVGEIFMRPADAASRRTATSAPRRARSPAAGSRSATWAAWTPTATSTSATARPT